MYSLHQSDHFFVDELLQKLPCNKHFIIVNKKTGKAIVDQNGLLLKMTYDDCVIMIDQLEKIYHYFSE